MWLDVVFGIQSKVLHCENQLVHDSIFGDWNCDKGMHIPGCHSIKVYEH